MRRRISLTLAAVGLFIGAAVLPDLGRPVSAQATPVDVAMGEFVFDPADLLVGAGVVTFNVANADSRRHNMTIDLNGTLMESETFAAGTGGMWEVALDQPGTYQFWCGVGNHRERGMVGTLTVP